MLEHLIIYFSLYYLLSGRLREVEDEGKFKTFKFQFLGHFFLLVSHEGIRFGDSSTIENSFLLFLLLMKQIWKNFRADFF